MYHYREHIAFQINTQSTKLGPLSFMLFEKESYLLRLSLKL